MNQDELTRQLEDGLAEVPMYDVHTHLTSGSLAARGLHDVLLYHMVISDLYAAGAPDGARLTPYPDAPDDAEAESRIERALPYLHRARNTSNAWGLRMILRDLYDWTEPIEPGNWRRLDAIIRERSASADWAYSILDRLRIARTNAEYTRRGEGADDSRLLYSLEWGMVTRAQWGEFDTPLYELERCWAMDAAGGPMEIGGGVRPDLPKRIRSAADADEATAHFVRLIPGYLIAMATHLSTDIDYTAPTAAEFEAALARRDTAGPAERGIYASYLNELLLTRLEAERPDVAFQFSFGAEPLPFETGARLRQDTLGQLALMIDRHPGLRFQVNNATRHANHGLASLARELPNLSIAGYWWHNFYPDSIRQLMSERLDMLPTTSQCAFFSDAYCIDWVYGKAMIVRKQLARVLAERVWTGQYDIDDALSIARSILFESAEHLLGMKPYEGWNDPSEI
ncbi:hypothetical protein Psi02_39930 [Planotetraspora silvatica]|uniref:Glucuronate isomerase n=1 Tax=Planotetraspora silvatica TaxID=234614 RepID=A0A8J3XNK8_9ACTN|nr:hypothetical protein [Planotetraspora silvatica]GII47569.1 hypothetical protein Psi02_39930 [Planotetraspora silvatica]